MVGNFPNGEASIEAVKAYPESIIRCLNHKDWYGALNLLLPLSLSADCYDDTTVDNFRKAIFLSWRSECFYETGQYDNCAVDCRRIMRLITKENPRNSLWFMSRWRLVHSLIPFQELAAKLIEAKSVIRELVKVCEGFLKHQCVMLLEEMEPDEPEQIKRCTRSSSNSKAVDVSHSPFFCTFCNMVLSSGDELGRHYWTKNHFLTIMSDVGRDWRKRPPPATFSSAAGTYFLLCPAFIDSEKGTCQRGSECENAHGFEELHEWRERFEFRRMKLLAEEALPYRKSYAELFLKKLTETSNRETLMKESLEYVDVEIEGEPNAIVYMQKSNQKWIFKMNTSRVLQAVVLLYNFCNRFVLNRITATLTKNEKEFTLIDEKPIKTREWISPFIEVDKNDDELITYKVEVVYLTEPEGFFKQSILFDFGHTPVLTKEIRVHVAFDSEMKKIKNLLVVSKEMDAVSEKMWTSNNTKIVFFETTQDEEARLTKYCVPNEKNYLLTESVHDDDLTANNYRSRMHRLLHIEEAALCAQVMKFNNPSSIWVSCLRPTLSGSRNKKIFSVNGEVFLCFHLKEDACQKWRVGRLLLNGCRTALVGDSREVTPESRRYTKNRKPTVYEALIVEIDQLRNVVYLRLSARAVTELELSTKINRNCVGLLTVQFQIDRRNSCRSHQAIDDLSDLEIIFPDMLRNLNLVDIIGKTSALDYCYNLNQIQKKAFDIITLPRSVILPPVLLVGYRGSGKTYTLAQVVKRILKEEDSKILICTTSNRAADLFVKEYLDPYVESGVREATPLRIYNPEDGVSLVHSVVLKYCLTEMKNNTRTFKIPTLEDVLNRRIIVLTLNVVSYLFNINLPKIKGYFTHMLIEEATETLEYQAIIPLTLADKNTRIVLTGDIQKPDALVHSPFARQKKFNVSLLRRLYSSYPSTYPSITLGECSQMVLQKPNNLPDKQQKSAPAKVTQLSRSSAKIRAPIIVPPLETPSRPADTVNFELPLLETPQVVLKPIKNFMSQVQQIPTIHHNMSFPHLGVSPAKSSLGVSTVNTSLPSLSTSVPAQSFSSIYDISFKNPNYFPAESNTKVST